MPLSPIDSRGIFGTRFVILGFLGMLVLSVLTLGIAAVEYTRVARATLEAADDTYATDNLGNIGEDLARERLHLAVGLSESRAEFVRQAGRRAAIEAHLQAAIDAVPAALDRAGGRWTALRPRIDQLRRVYADAELEIEAGRPARGSAILLGARPLMTGVHDALDELERAHRETVLAGLRSAHRDATWVVTIGFVLAAIFVTGMTGIFGVMLRLLRRQGRRVAEYTARLEAANADLDAFAGRVAHDLRNALAPLVMSPSLLRDAPGDEALVQRVAERTERSSRRALGIVDALLAFSRAARTAEVGEVGSVRFAVREVLDELAPLIAQLDATVEVAELPDLHVRCSPGLLHVVLANLCGNAVKYLDGRPERRVRIAAHVDGEACRIEVEDTGPGIPKHALEKVFEPFYRVADSRVPGIGIGLATVRRILDARGGRVMVESDAGRGARFQVWLPLAAPLAPSPTAGAPAA
ncbi:MAG TPA: HAMP domain-containing sensor histidine kinase [Kofleriaceae bacterium]|nr:HAMP domain-containing sensor histidine kinase [Kofleriaceae bacterium]